MGVASTSHAFTTLTLTAPHAQTAVGDERLGDLPALGSPAPGGPRVPCHSYGGASPSARHPHGREGGPAPAPVRKQLQVSKHKRTKAWVAIVTQDGTSGALVALAVPPLNTLVRIGGEDPALSRIAVVTQAVRLAERMLGPGPPASLAFLAADPVCHDSGAVVVVPGLQLRASKQLATALGGRWLPLSQFAEVDGGRSEAAAAFAAVATCRAWSGADVHPRSDVGAGRAFALPVPRHPPPPNVYVWQQQIKWAEAGQRALAAALKAVKCPDAAYYEHWAERMTPPKLEAIPHSLRSAALELPPDRIIDTPFAARGGTPLTERRPPPRKWISKFAPRSIEDILMPDALNALAMWLQSFCIDMRGIAKLGEKYRCRLRSPLIITQSQFHPDARGVVWDLRSRDADGAFRPLDVGTPFHTHLDVSWLEEQLGQEFPDQALISHLREGVSFGVDDDMPLAVVLQPHLLSLAKGFHKVEKEIHRYASLGWYELRKEMPFLPIRCTSQGTTPRKLELDRPRRTTDAGNPRNPVTTSDGTVIRSLNETINMKANKLDSPPPGSWPKETKPHVEDKLHNDTILLHAARFVFQEPMFDFTDDAKDYFSQLGLAPSQLWFCCCAWIPNEGYTPLWVVEQVLGFGVSASSNVAQRLAWALVAIVKRQFDAEEASILDHEKDPVRRAWIRRRRELSCKTKQNECRLYDVHMYTDDPCFTVVGVKRAVRLIACWRRITCRFRLIMAIPQKRQLSSGGVLWLGVIFFAQLGIAVIPADKRLRATAALVEVARGRGTFDSYRSLCGLLEHIRPLTGQTRRVMYGAYFPMRKRLGPTDNIGAATALVEFAHRWIDLLAVHPGASYETVYEPNPTRHPVSFSLYSDAALDGAAIPALGGFFHGAWWAMPLEPGDLAGKYRIPIPPLELAAAGINVMIAEPSIGPAAAATMYCDSSTSVSVLENDSARAPLMQFIHEAVRNFPEFQRLNGRLFATHLFGEGNPFADCASRGKYELLTQLCANIRVTAMRVDIPPAALAFLDAVRTRHREIVDEEGGRGKAVSGCDAGDGPYREERWRILSAPLRRGPGPTPHPVIKRPKTQNPARPLLPPPPQQWPHVPQRVATGPTWTPSQTHPVGQAPTGRAVSAAASPLAASTTSLIEELTSDTSPWAVSADRTVILRYNAAVDAAITDSVPTTSQKQLDGNWSWWVRVTTAFHTAPWRGDIDANSGADPRGFRREAFLLVAAYLWIYERMKPRSKKDPAPNPKSVMKVLAGVRRLHRLRGIKMVSTVKLALAIRGVIRRHVMEHGPESLQPKRKEPLSRSIFQKLRAVPSGKVRVAGNPVCWESPEMVGVWAAMCTAKEAGFRKAEVALPNKERWSKARITRANLSWKIRGQLLAAPSRAQLESLQPGDHACLRPPPSKTDVDGSEWGQRPIWLPFRQDRCTAAHALRVLELTFPVAPAARKEVPLFCVARDHAPLRHKSLDDILHALLVEALGTTRAKRYSFHSFRIALACELLAANASTELIQALCRWRSDASIKLYARLNPEDYAHWIMAAADQEATSILASNLPTIDADDGIRALDAAALELAAQEDDRDDE